MDPPVSDITFFGSKEVSWIPLSMTLRFLDQRRSVGSPCHSVSDITFFGSKEVSWIPLSVMLRFWIKGGQLDPPVSDVTLFGSKEVSWIPLSVTFSLLYPFVGNVPEMQKRSSRNTKMQLQKFLNSVAQRIWNSSAFAIDVSGCAHSRHGVLNLDHHGQELSQLPGQRQPHTWWGFVVWFVKCNVFLAMYPRTTFCGFGSTTATCSPSHGRRRLPWPRPSRGSWCCSPTPSFGQNPKEQHIFLRIPSLMKYFSLVYFERLFAKLWTTCSLLITVYLCTRLTVSLPHDPARPSIKKSKSRNLHS